MRNQDSDVYLVNVSPARGNEELHVAVTVTISGRPGALNPTTKTLPYREFKQTMGRVFQTPEEILAKNDEKIFRGQNVVIYMTVSPKALVDAGFMDGAQLSQ
jgi:hypothetical protein